jgi:ADP-ribose pyrophosphatase YjhB (NUDIX family)
MHRLQQHILSQLIHYPERRYADLKPDEVEGNLFMYHLRQLMAAGWVIKREDGKYELTPDGLRYAESLSLKTFSPRIQPRIVTLLVCRNEVGEVLLYRRHRQPLIGLSGFPYGKIHLGETILEAAGRELSEKTGLAARLTHRGDGYITTYVGAEMVSQIMFHLFEGTQIKGQLLRHVDGEAHWITEAEIAEHKTLPSVIDLLRLLETHKERFFTELVYHLEPVASK